MTSVDFVHRFASKNRSRFVADLKEFISFPSISTQPQHTADVRRCAEWLADHLHGIGLEHVQVIPTRRHPVVYADWLNAPQRPTILIYGHYDVQPVDPVSDWRVQPFGSAVHDNYLYGRGSSDDKGQLFCHVKAIESYLRTIGGLPVNVRCIFEGEEEIGSPNLRAFLNDNSDMLAADVAVISDTAIPAPDQPAIICSLRGALNLEVEVSGPKRDLHSGIFGGAVLNPLQALCSMISRLHDPDGQLAIPGLYDDVKYFDREERARLQRTGLSDAEIQALAGVERGWGEPGYSAYERTTVRPSLTVTGITGGYQERGIKAVIPARAIAKIDIRLVPDQDPKRIEELFRKYIAAITPSGVCSTVRTYLRVPPVALYPEVKAIRAARTAYRMGFRNTPISLRSGGTIPVVPMLQEELGISPLLMGFGLPDDGIHGPNEKFSLPNYYNGISTCITLYSELGKNRSGNR